MKFLVPICVLFLSAIVSRAQDAAVQGAYEISSGGTQRRFMVVEGEVAVKLPDGRRKIEKVSAGDVARGAKTVRARQGAAAQVELVLAEDNKGPKARKRVPARHFVTREVLVKLRPGTTAKTVAKASGLRIVREPSYAPGFVIFDATTSEDALVAMGTLRALPEVESADVMLASQKAKKWTPNDPFFSEQWHHRNTTQLGGALWVDTNVSGAWDSFKGAGITIGILDDGVQHAHPDLQPNYNTAIDYDYNSNDADPTPVDLVDDSHGTACAGVAGARGNNGIGVTGAAPEATLTGFRLIAAPNTDQNEADAFSAHNDVIHVKSNSWGWPDGGGYGGPEALATAALENGATSGRGGKGVVYVFAGGNGLYEADNSNFDGYAASPYVLAVAAVNDFGFQSYYSEPGANLLISAPSSGGGHNEGIRTTDITGEGGYNNTAAGAGNLPDQNYTNDFGGTSSACPLVSGIVALILEANPNLGWRDVHEILIRTARKNHRTDPDWATNSAGLSFNHKYGAGIIDASAAVALAQQWTNLPALTTTQVSQTGIAALIPDDSATGVSRALNISTANFRVERVAVTVSVTHPARGDLEIILTSPSGMVSKLAQPYPDGTDNLNWTFTTTHHWGESGAGNWTVKVADRVPDDFGTLNAVTVKLFGTTSSGARIAGVGTALMAEGNVPANSAADPGEAITINVDLKNIGGTATSALTATLLPVGGVREPSAAQGYGVVAAGGAAVTRSFSCKLDGGCGMSIPLLLKLQDGATDLGFVSVNVPLGTSTASTLTGGAVVIPDNAAAVVSNVTASGLVGRVQDMRAQINGFSHSYINDVGALLVSPDALKIRLICGGSSGTATAANLTFDDDAAVIFPEYGSTLPSGSYRPWDYYGSSRVFIRDTGGEELAFTMSEFRGLPSNGTWKLLMQDFGALDTGSLSGWKLVFTTVTCTDNVIFTQAATNGAEAAGSIEVSVTRTGGLEGSAAVNYATSSGTAIAGSDFTAVSGSLSFAPGELAKSFSVPIVNDATLESDETILVTLSGVTGSSTLGTLASGTITITDDDAPTPVSISPVAQTVNEGSTELIFTVSRSTTGNAGTVAYATTSGTATSGADFAQTSGILSFGAGDLSQTFSVTLLDDNTLESPESFTVVISAPTGGLSLDTADTATVTIIDGDTDSDGMPDDFEISVGLNPAVNDAALDLDGDGVSNYDEFVLGTPPNSGRDSFEIGSSFTGGGDVGISFPSLVGRTYRVDRSETLVPPWTSVQTNISGTGSSILVIDVGAAALPRRFYRVTVTLP